MTNILLRRSAVAAGTVALGVAELVALRSVAGIDVAARVGTTVQHITVAAVAMAAAAAALAGWVLLALLERITTRGRIVWIIIAVAVLLLSMLAGPAAGVSPGAQAALALLHLSVGAVIILAMPARTKGVDR